LILFSIDDTPINNPLFLEKQLKTEYSFNRIFIAPQITKELFWLQVK